MANLCTNRDSYEGLDRTQVWDVPIGMRDAGHSQVGGHVEFRWNRSIGLLAKNQIMETENIYESCI